MTEQPTEQELQAFANARRTPVVVAEGTVADPSPNAVEGNMVLATLGGIKMILVEDRESGEALLELRSSQIVSARMKAQFLASKAFVEIVARSREAADDGARQPVVIWGAKNDLKAAFAALGHSV